MKFRGFVYLLLVLALIPQSNAFLGGWEYRNEVVINSSTALSDYQVKINFQGYDSSQPNYIDFSKIKLGGADIRITDTSDNLLNFYIESWNDTSLNSTIWVKVSSISTPNSSIYVYFDNIAANSVSNGDNTFLFFDDFLGNLTGQNWTKYSGNPVLDVVPATWEDSKVGDPWVEYNLRGDGVYDMWYWGCCDLGRAQIGYANSTDGITWIKYAGNPIITFGVTYDSLHAHKPSVVYLGGTYYLYYSSQNLTHRSISLATSSTNPWGIFTKSASNPIIVNDTAWETDYVDVPSVMYDSDASLFKMWYGGDRVCSTCPEPKLTGYATSLDGISWTKYVGNPILIPSTDTQTFYSAGIAGLNVIKLGSSSYEGYFVGYDTYGYITRIGMATSTDGISWNLSQDNLIVDLGDVGQWDDTFIYRPKVEIINNIKYMWYNALFSGDSLERIGRATLIGTKPIIDRNIWNTYRGGTGVKWDIVNNNLVLESRTAAKFASIQSKTYISAVNTTIDVIAKWVQDYTAADPRIAYLYLSDDNISFLDASHVQLMFTHTSIGVSTNKLNKDIGWGIEHAIYGTPILANTTYISTIKIKPSNYDWVFYDGNYNELGAILNDNSVPVGVTYPIGIGAWNTKTEIELIRVRSFNATEPTYSILSESESSSISSYVFNGCRNIGDWGNIGFALIAVLLIVIAGSLAIGWFTGSHTNVMEIANFTGMIIVIVVIGLIAVALISPIFNLVGCTS